MEALEKPKEKRTKSIGSHGVKSNASVVDPAAATQQHVRLRIKLPVSPARNSVGSMKGSRPTTSSKPAAAIHQEPATSDLSDHKSSGTEPTSPASEYQNLSNTSLKELRVTLDFAHSCRVYTRLGFCETIMHLRVWIFSVLATLSWGEI